MARCNCPRCPRCNEGRCDCDCRPEEIESHAAPGAAAVGDELPCTDSDNCRRCSEDADTPHTGIQRGRLATPSAPVGVEGLGLIQRLIAWNRSQEIPPIRFGYEAAVAEFFCPAVSVGDAKVAVRRALLALAVQFDGMGDAAYNDHEYDRRDVWRNAASQARTRAKQDDWIDAAIASKGDSNG